MSFMRFNYYLLAKLLASNFGDNHFPSIALTLFSAKHYVLSASYSTAGLRHQSEGKRSDIMNFGGGLRKTGTDFQESLSFVASVCDGVEEKESEEGEGFSDDDSLEFITSFRGSKQQQRESIARIEIGEAEFRHPLVREVCRLITLRSAWNPDLEGHLRHLLRCLKPPLVCAVLRSQTDERVALNCFYWADRQWRYRHDTIVYYTMLYVLSKTKLCQGARRVLRLMTRRGIKCSPEAFGYVMVSYSRAGKLRNALRVLTLMQ